MIVDGDLFKAKEKYICHQCNCVTQKSAHLSATMFARFPYANVYSGRTDPDKLGTIAVRGNGDDQRFVINMFGQFYPGVVRYPNGTKDGHEVRLKAFQSCLTAISRIKDLESVAFPWGIACGAAGGDWETYLSTLQYFADNVGVPVKIYRLPGVK